MTVTSLVIPPYKPKRARSPRGYETPVEPSPAYPRISRFRPSFHIPHSLTHSPQPSPRAAPTAPLLRHWYCLLLAQPTLLTSCYWQWSAARTHLRYYLTYFLLLLLHMYSFTLDFRRRALCSMIGHCGRYSFRLRPPTLARTYIRNCLQLSIAFRLVAHNPPS